MTELTWVGHATALVDSGTTRVLTDPLLTKRVAHLRRRVPVPGPDAADVDVVLLSHAHGDHLHLPSLKRIRRDAQVLTPAGTGRLLRSAGFRDVTEVRTGDRATIGDVSIEVVPAAHSHKRGPHSRVEARPVGYIIDDGSNRVYFPGDTDLFDSMGDLADIDVALLPIWGWGSTLGTGHLDPARAAIAAERIAPRLIVPIHWGTYAPEDGRRRTPTWFHDPPEQFEAAITERHLTDSLRVVQPGDGIVL
ncbi:MAG: MBL fold metallo-hydrolase [Ilumatobacteraceae bacterium]